MTRRRLGCGAALPVVVALGCARSHPLPAVPPADPGRLERAGVLAYQSGRYAEARAELQAARALLEARGERELAWARVLQDLAEVHRVLGDPAEAESLLRQTLATRQALLPAGDPEIGRTLNNLGLALADQGRRPEAEEAQRRAVANLEAALGPDHVDVAMPLGNLSTVLSGLHRCDEAEAVGRRSLAIREAHLPATHPDVGRALAAVAHAVACDPARYPEAARYHARAIAGWEHSLGPEHPHLALGLYGWASDAAAAGRLDVAERLLARALRIQEARLPPGNPVVARTRRRYEDVRRARSGAVDRPSL
jgi:tetratricopeptide (TPR) repeat protein